MSDVIEIEHYSDHLGYHYVVIWEGDEIKTRHTFCDLEDAEICFEHYSRLFTNAIKIRSIGVK